MPHTNLAHKSTVELQHIKDDPHASAFDKACATEILKERDLAKRRQRPETAAPIARSA